MPESPYAILTAAERAEATRGRILEAERNLHALETMLGINEAVLAATTAEADRTEIKALLTGHRKQRRVLLATLPILRERHAREVAEIPPEDGEEP